MRKTQSDLMKTVAAIPLMAAALAFASKPTDALAKSKTAAKNRMPASTSHASTHSVWSRSTEASVLKETFHPMKGESVTKPLYTCEGVAGAGTTDGPGVVMPRVVFRGPNSASIWICSTEHGTQVKPNAVHILGNVTVFYKQGDRAPQKLIAQTGELAHPVDVESGENEVRVVDNYVIRHGAKIVSWRPMTHVVVACEGEGAATSCTVAKPKCVLALQKKDDRQIVSRFDKAVQKYKDVVKANAAKGKAAPVMELSEPFQLLDEVLLAAASGDKKAADRLQNFPIQPEGPAIELVGNYNDQLDKLKMLGCFESHPGHP